MIQRAGDGAKVIHELPLSRLELAILYITRYCQ